MKQGLFITATDTGVGKTIATLVLGTLLKEEGFKVGVMKPVQCAGNDATFLRKQLNLNDPPGLINPYFAPEPLSPHLAFKRAKIKIDIQKIITSYKELQRKYDMVLVEGAGGLMVPILNNYLVADLIKDLDLYVVIVSRLGLGTINHSLLTIHQAQNLGIDVKGLIFTQATSKKNGLPEETNPKAVEEFGRIKVLGTIPFLKEFTKKEILKKCSLRVDLKPLYKKALPARTKHLQKWDKAYVWHPFTQMKDWVDEDPLVIDHAKGSYLEDTAGRSYLDGVSSLWVNVHGHRHRDIDLAIKKQIDKVSHSTFLGLSNVPAIELAKELVSVAPKSLEKVFYSDNGSAAVEIAIKMAYQYWQNKGITQKKFIVHLKNSYHGDTLGSVSIGGIDLFHKLYKPLTFKTLELPSPDYYHESKGMTKSEFTRQYLLKAKEILSQYKGTTAALVVEPLVQAAAGMIVWPKGVLKGLARICKDHNILFIADEVATGFGRTGTMFACEHEGVSPDILCLAKGITGGYLPLAATLTTQEIYDGFLFDYKDLKTFFHGHTYTANPLACAAALANLEVFKKEKTLRVLKEKIIALAEGLKSFDELEHVGDIRQCGFMVGIEIVKNKETRKPYSLEEKIGIRICQEVRKEGVILRPLGQVIVLMPPLSLSPEELRLLLSVTRRAIKRITEG